MAQWKKYLVDIVLVITLPLWVVPLLVFGLIWVTGYLTHEYLWGEDEHNIYTRVD